MAFTYRNTKGSELTYAELDENFETVELLHDATLLAQAAAEAAAAIAVAAANFKGTYASRAGSLNKPASVFHAAKYWMLLTDLADVTTQVPGASAAWQVIPTGGLTEGDFHAATSKPTPADADEFGFLDSANGFALVKGAWANIKAAVKTWLIAQANTWTGNQTFSGTITAAGGVLVTGGALGYGPGAGGTVTQATSKSTAVTLNKQSGRITMNNAALAAGAYVFFNFNNSLLSAGDILFVQPTGGGGGNEYQAWVSYTAAGVAVICLRNNSGASRSDAAPIDFAIFPRATS